MLQACCTRSFLRLLTKPSFANNPVLNFVCIFARQCSPRTASGDGPAHCPPPSECAGPPFSSSAALHCTRNSHTSLQHLTRLQAPDVRHCKGSLAVLRIKRHPTSIVRDIDRAAPMAWEQLSAPCTTLSLSLHQACRETSTRQGLEIIERCDSG